MVGNSLVGELRYVISDDAVIHESETCKILVAMASSSKKEIVRSIRSAIDAAKNPKRLVFAVCVANVSADEIKSEFEDVTIYVKSSGSVNTTVAHRYFASVCDGCDYILYVSEHSRFRSEWDALLACYAIKQGGNVVLSLNLVGNEADDTAFISWHDYDKIFKGSDSSEEDDVEITQIYYYFAPISVCKTYDMFDFRNYSDIDINGLVCHYNGLTVKRPDDIYIWYQYVDTDLYKKGLK